MNTDKYTFIISEDFKSIWFWANFLFIVLSGLFFNGIVFLAMLLAVGFNIFRDKTGILKHNEDSVYESTAGYLFGFMAWMILFILKSVIFGK